MAKRNRDQRVRANRSMVRLERGYTKALHKYQRRTARMVSAQMTILNIEIVIHDRAPGLRDLIRVWMKRVVFLFGPDVIQRLNTRTGGGAPETRDALSTFTESVLLWLDDYSLSQATTISGTMVGVARSALIRAFEMGLGEREAAKLLREKVGGSAAGAARIARTEVHTAANIGSDEAARATGLELIKEWATTEDGNARPTHVEADGQRRGMDEPFSVGGSSLDFPGDPKGPAKEIINCRCVALYHPVINGEVFD